MILKGSKNFWIDIDWGTVTDILGTIIQTLVLAAAIYAIMQTNKSLKHSKKALDNNEKALENSQKALEISQSDNELLKKQLAATFKPDFKFQFEKFMYTNNVDDKNRIPTNTLEEARMMADYKVTVENVSSNQISEVKIDNYFYIDSQEITEFENILNTDLSYVRHKDDISYLGSNESIDIYFTRYAKYFLRYSSAGKVNGSPLLFLRIKYKNVLDEESIVCYMFKNKTSVQGRHDPEPDEYTELWIQEKVSEDYYQTLLEDLTINLEELENERSK
ncbi:hypothetical protein ACWEXK_12290 [Staphylococcus xylosus]